MDPVDKKKSGCRTKIILILFTTIIHKSLTYYIFPNMMGHIDVIFSVSFSYIFHHHHRENYYNNLINTDEKYCKVVAWQES